MAPTEERPHGQVETSHFSKIIDNESGKLRCHRRRITHDQQKRERRSPNWSWVLRVEWDPGVRKKRTQRAIILPNCYSSLPSLMAEVDKKRLANICKALPLCLNGMIDRYDDFSPVFQCSTIHRRDRFCLFPKKDHMLFLCQIIRLFSCSTMSSELVIMPEGIISGKNLMGSTD